MESLPEGWAKDTLGGITYYYYGDDKYKGQYIHPNKVCNVWGDTNFVKNCIQEYRAIQGVLAAGSYGSVKRVTVNGTPYFVKEMRWTYAIDSIKEAVNKIYSKYYFIEKEITVAVDLTKRIPQYVSNIKGGRIDITPHVNKHNDPKFNISGFLIYEAPPGMTLEDYLQHNRGKISKSLYDTLYCMIKNAQIAVNAMGYVHRDIKPNNMYMLTDSSGYPINCKLIDFGFSEKLTDASGNPRVVPRLGTPDYAPPEISTYHLYPQQLSTAQNDYSIDVIWRRRFTQDNNPKPECPAPAPVAQEVDLTHHIDLEDQQKHYKTPSSPVNIKVPGLVKSTLTPLHSAVLNIDIASVKKILAENAGNLSFIDQKVTIQTQNSNGTTKSNYKSARGLIDIFSLFVSQPTNIRLSLMKNRLQLIKCLLLKAGAKAKYENSFTIFTKKGVSAENRRLKELPSCDTISRGGKRTRRRSYNRRSKSLRRL